MIENKCECCGKHVPLPTIWKSWDGIDVCPTTYYNIVEYKRIWNSLGHQPPGNIRKHFSEYVQGMVQRAIDNK